MDKQGKLFHGVEIQPAKAIWRLLENNESAVVIIASGSAHIIKKTIVRLRG